MPKLKKKVGSKDRKHYKNYAPMKARWCWYNITQRCFNESNKSYPHYGGRGIKCLWNNFGEFWSDMKSGYMEGLEIDRIDNGGDYCKENCRWSTRTEQMQNTRRIKKILYHGEIVSATGLAKILKIPRNTVFSRIQRAGLSKEPFFTSEMIGFI